MESYIPYPISKFKHLDRIRELTRHDKMFTIEDVFGQKIGNTIEDDDEKKYDSKRLGDSDHVDSQNKKFKSVVNINEYLENNDDTTVQNLWETYKDEDPEALSDQSFEKLLHLCVNLNHETELESTTKILEKYLQPTLSHLDESSSLTIILSTNINLVENLHQNLKIVFILELIKVNAEIELMIKLLENQEFSVEQDKSILLCFVQNNDDIAGDRTELVELILNRNPRIYSCSHEMEALSLNLRNNLSQQRDKCPRFSKFLLQIVTKVAAGLNTSVYEHLSVVIENNKTFLKKRMIQELKKKYDQDH